MRGRYRSSELRRGWTDHTLVGKTGLESCREASKSSGIDVVLDGSGVVPRRLARCLPEYGGSRAGSAEEPLGATHGRSATPGGRVVFPSRASAPRRPGRRRLACRGSGSFGRPASNACRRAFGAPETSGALADSSRVPQLPPHASPLRPDRPYDAARVSRRHWGHAPIAEQSVACPPSTTPSHPPRPAGRVADSPVIPPKTPEASPPAAAPSARARA
jgi:hypothetical protein